ncbi:NAD(P)-dependent oxidoreductase [Sinorhizobium chiapasense]|uniref:NAD(P)-dependent oxidoreductase n=1 Tax=Sinorhizobium chiapasense TaxID=501572 RepID=A0ABZ2BCJ3_9HYPH
MSVRVGFVGVGAMGLAMASHALKAGFAVAAYDLDAECLAKASAAGITAAKDLADLATMADVFIAVVATDDQSRAVTRELALHVKKSSVIAIAATNNPGTMRELGEYCDSYGVNFIDAPVVYGLEGAREGTLLSLCGGREDAVEMARPVLMSYSRDVLHVGDLGSGQLAKACNNLLHWIHCVGNYEALLLAKRYGVDAQRMREILLKSPGYNNTLERWDGTRFTWHEKDMDVVLDLAQAGGLVLPLSGQTDQLIKLLSPADVRDLLYGPEAHYLGRRVVPFNSEARTA